MASSTRLREAAGFSTPVSVAAVRCLFWKHCRQSTGRPCVGLNGTVVSTPHSEQCVRVSVREMPAAAGPAPVLADRPARFDLQGLHRFGSFLNCLSKKKSCSPAVKMNSPPQSTQVKILSTNSMAATPVVRKLKNFPCPLQDKKETDRRGDRYLSDLFEGGPGHNWLAVS